MLHHGQDVLSQEKGGSRGVNMETGPYGDEGVWSNGRSVSARARVEASGQTSQVMRGHGWNTAAKNWAGSWAASLWGARWTAPRAAWSPAGLGGQLFGPGAARAAVQAVGRHGSLQVFQTLSESQFLLDGHTQERIQSLLLILSCCQLPLHLIQLGDILVTPASKHDSQ